VVQTLITWLKDPEQDSLRRAFAVWMNRVLLPARLPGQEIPEVHDLMEAEAMLEERVKEWTVEWKEAGIQQGKQQGESTLLLHLLILKFGKLEQQVIDNIISADAETLLAWSGHVLTATTLDDVFRQV